MKTVLYLLAGVLVVLAASWTYTANYQVQDAEERVSALQRQITRERSRIAVMEAEWAYLNRPVRLRALVETYHPELQLITVDATRYMAINDLPTRAGAAPVSAQQVAARMN